MSVEEHTVSFSLEVNVEKAYSNVRRLQTVLFRLLGLFRRLGLPENIDNAIAKLQRVIMLANQARLAIAALEASMGPVGWTLLAISAITTAWSTYEFIEYDLRGR